MTVHCDQNDSYEITINDYQVRTINEIRNVSYFAYFSDLITIYSYVITIILIILWYLELLVNLLWSDKCEML